MIHSLFSDAPFTSCSRGPQVPDEVKVVNEEHVLAQKHLTEQRVELLQDATELLALLTVQASLHQGTTWSVDDEITLWFHTLDGQWDAEDASLYAAIRYLRGTECGTKPPTPELTMLEVCYFPA